MKVEITPDKGYLYPDDPWSFSVDEDNIPSWFTDEHKAAALRAHTEWKKEVEEDADEAKKEEAPKAPEKKEDKPQNQDRLPTNPTDKTESQGRPSEN